ncbi:MAG: hypothetical protein AAB074_20805 [Planctomycetota bacterium]
MTLSDEGVNAAIEDRWVSTWHNQCPGLYCNNTADSRKPIPYPPEQLATIYEGTGGGNIRLYFCDPDGKVVHYVSGFLDRGRLLEEEEFARGQMSRTDEMRRTWCKLHAPDWSDWSGFVYPRKSEILDHRTKDVQAVPHGEDVREVLREVEDNIYLKGAIG